MVVDIDNIAFAEAAEEETEQETNRFPEDPRSGEIQDIISERPGFWGVWALPIFLVILLVIAAGAWFIRYPDTIFANATLVATDGPREIIPRQQGRLTALFVQNGELVSGGEQIGWIESTADHREVLQLSSLLDSSAVLLEQGKTQVAATLFKKNFNNLGGCNRPTNSSSLPGSSLTITW